MCYIFQIHKSGELPALYNYINWGQSAFVSNLPSSASDTVELIIAILYQLVQPKHDF